MSLKNEYEGLKKRYERVKKSVATLQGQKQMATKNLEKIDEKLSKLTKGRDAQEILDKLEKEIEARMEMLGSQVTEYENTLEDFMANDPKTENQSADDFDFKIGGLNDI